MTLEVNKMYNMDFREGLHLIEEPFQIVSDPPYNQKFKYNSYEDNLTDGEYIDMIGQLKGHNLAIIHYPEETMKYFVPALGVPDEVMVWCYNLNLPRQSRLINFYGKKPDFRKVTQPYKDMTDKRVIEMMKRGKTGAKIYDWFSDIQIVKNTSKEKLHPCPIPVKLVERIILLTTQEGDLVVDTFGGSGTLAVACLNTNRRYILFEKDKHYFDIAVKRVEEHKTILSGGIV